MYNYAESASNLTAHPLWAKEYWQLVAFFEKDETINVGEVQTINGEHSCSITVDDPKKALYLAELINTYELEVKIDDGLSNNEKMEYICKDNPYFHGLTEVIDPQSGIIKYAACEFAPTCISWYSDDFFSPTGHTAILPYQLAKEIFYHRGINFQTHIEE